MLPPNLMQVAFLKKKLIMSPLILKITTKANVFVAILETFS